MIVDSKRSNGFSFPSVDLITVLLGALRYVHSEKAPVIGGVCRMYWTMCHFSR